jgi:hypothetical protein
MAAWRASGQRYGSVANGMAAAGLGGYRGMMRVAKISARIIMA